MGSDVSPLPHSPHHSEAVEQLWRDAFLETLAASEEREALREAAIAGNLGVWTARLTAVVVASCGRLGWAAAGKGHELGAVPKAGQEYLGIDVMAFAAERGDGADGPRWRWPLAAFELENSTADARVAYSLWKLLCVRAPLRVVFAYRRDWERGRALVGHLSEQVIAPLARDVPAALDGPVVIALGSRGEGETFPHGYFKFWRLDSNVLEFVKF